MRRATRNGSILGWALGVLVLLAALALAGLWWIRENPLRFYEMSTRRSLERAGLELRYHDTSAGRLAYWEAGEGQPLVLLHGVGDQSGAFQGIVAGLVPEYRVIVPDLPGHGESEPSEGPLQMSVVYGGLEELLGAVPANNPAILVGHSMGAWLATLVAHRRPELVERVVLVNGGALTGDRPDLSLTPADREAARTLMAALRDPASPPTPDYVLDDIVERSASGPIGRMTAEIQDLIDHLLDGRLGEVTVPVDLLWGESDQLMSPAYAERMLAQLPRARLTTIPGCGHHPANECPQKLAAGLAEVLAMAPVPPAPEASPPQEAAEAPGS